MESPDDINLEELKKKFTLEHKNFIAVSNRINETQNPEDKNKLELQKERLFEEFKKTYQEIAELSVLILTQILTDNLDTANIQTAYKACHLSGDIPDTVKAIVQDLYDVDKPILDSDKAFDRNHHTTKFIKYLITNSQIPQTTLEDLKKWGSNHIEDFDKLIQDVKKQDRNTDTKPESYILIKIEPSKIKSRIKKFNISAWVIPNIQNNEDCCKIDVSNCPNDSFTIKEIEKKINLIFTEKITFPLQRDINLVVFCTCKYTCNSSNSGKNVATSKKANYFGGNIYEWFVRT
jgi:hypothetical protein